MLSLIFEFIIFLLPVAYEYFIIMFIFYIIINIWIFRNKITLEFVIFGFSDAFNLWRLLHNLIVSSVIFRLLDA
jgi:hypothetical protein